MATYISSDTLFASTHRSEVTELLQFFKNNNLERDEELQLHAVKRVIAYMTLGVDVSPVFTHMVMASNTRSIVQKKLVYLYLCNYAESHPDLSLLCINTLRKDCTDHNPMIRGLALRAISSLRLPHLMEYLVPPARDGLKDHAPYVRKTAVMACAKLHNLAPSYIDEEFVNYLYDMLLDKDTSVATNSVLALNQILAEEGGMAVTPEIAGHLMNIVDEAREGGQCAILETLKKYQPDESTIYDAMNMVEPSLSSCNSAVVMSAVHLFLKWSEDNVALLPKVYKRIKAPLLSLMEGTGTELQYTILLHLEAIANRADGAVFETDFKHFFCRHNEPNYIRLVKLKILQESATKENCGAIVEELRHYVMDKDEKISFATISTMNAMGRKLEEILLVPLLELFYSFVDLNVAHLTRHALSAIRDILRVRPDAAEQGMEMLARNMYQIKEDGEAKAIAVWMLGEFGIKYTKHVPYIIEHLSTTYLSEAKDVRLQLLIAATKIYFERPAEMLPTLKYIMKRALEDSSIEVQDRALLYYRLMAYDVKKAKVIVLGAKNPVTAEYPEEKNYDTQDRVFDEFNTLSVVYGKPSIEWLDSHLTNISLDVEVEYDDVEEDFEVTYKGEEEEEEKNNAGESQGDGESNGEREKEKEKEPLIAMSDYAGASNGVPQNGHQYYTPPGYVHQGVPSQPESNHVGQQPHQPTAPSQAPPSQIPPAHPPVGTIELHATPRIDQTEFQQLWMALPVGFKLSLRSSQMPQPDVVEARMAAQRIFTMASGDVGNEMKFYFYSQDAISGTLFLVEMIIAKAEKTLTIVIKGENQQLVPAYVDKFKRSL